MAHYGIDTLVLDIPAARLLTEVMGGAAANLGNDEAALDPLLEDAIAILRRDRSAPLQFLRSARRGLDELAADLGRRLALVDVAQQRIGQIDALTSALVGWDDRASDPATMSMESERRRLVLLLVGGDVALGARVMDAIGGGLNAADALVEVDRLIRFDERVAAAMTDLGISFVPARELVERIDRELGELAALGFTHDESVGAVALADHFGLAVSAVADRTAVSDVGPIEAIGEMLTANALGVTLFEFDALGGLRRHFDVFDNATGGRADGRVSAADLRFVTENVWLFTAGQLIAAQALLALPGLRNRLDTADENADTLAAEGFGRTDPGDGLIAESDLRAFMLKSQINHLLRDHADIIDVADDPSGVVDGIRSQNDFRRFLGDNPDLPVPVVAAAETMLANGWFDESWWQEHKDELALGAAVLAGGIVVIATGGGAGLLYVAAAAGGAAGGTTIVINLATGDDLLADVASNSLKGVIVGVGVHSVATGAAAYGAAATPLARSAAVASTTAGATDVISIGGADLLLPEDYEEAAHDYADAVNMVASGWEMTYEGGGWIASRMATFESLDDQLDALSTAIARQRQGRHVAGAVERTEGYGGYFHDEADAQSVLDAVHDGTAEILGRTNQGDILVRVEGIEGINLNSRFLFSDQPTDLFIIKGTSSPSVVPTSPMASPASPTRTDD